MILILIYFSVIAPISWGEESIFAAQTQTELAIKKTNFLIQRRIKRTCELELELESIPQTCYQIPSFERPEVLDQRCLSAVRDGNLTMEKLTQVASSRLASGTCRKYVKDRIAILKYKEESTLNQ